MKKITFRDEQFKDTAKIYIELEKPTCREISDFCGLIVDKEVAIMKSFLDEAKDIDPKDKVGILFNLRSKKLTIGVNSALMAVNSPDNAEEFVSMISKRSNVNLKDYDLEPQDFTNIAVTLIIGDYVPKQKPTEEDEKKA